MFYTRHTRSYVSIEDELIDFQNLVVFFFVPIEGTNPRRPTVSQTDCRRGIDTVITMAAIMRISAINIRIQSAHLFAYIRGQRTTDNGQQPYTRRVLYTTITNEENRKLTS